LAAVVALQRGDGLADDVVLARRYGVAVDVVGHPHAEADAGGSAGGEVVVQRDRLVDGVWGVEAVLTGGADAEAGVDLRRGADHERVLRREGHARPRASPSAMRAKSSTASTSPRAVGSTPADSSAAVAASAEPASPRSAARTCLRRWAKAASTTAKTS